MSKAGTVHSGGIEFDVAARQAQVIGDGPRIAPLAIGDISEDGMALVREIRSMFNIPEDGSLPDVSLITLRHPALFRCQMQMGIELAGRGSIDPRDRELAVMRIAWLCRAPFEWSEHVVIGKKFGLTGEEVERVTQGSSAPGWSARDAAILRGVEELIGDHCLSDATWETLSAFWDEKQMLEFPMLVGSYTMTAMQQNTLRVPLNPAYSGLNDR